MPLPLMQIQLILTGLEGQTCFETWNLMFQVWLKPMLQLGCALKKLVMLVTYFYIWNVRLKQTEPEELDS